MTEYREKYRNKICELYERGDTQKIIAKKLDIASGIVSEIVREEGFETGKGKINKDEVVRLYTEEGMSQNQVAEKLDTDQGYVSEILSDRGVDTGFNGYWTEQEDKYLKENYPPDNPEQKQEMIKHLSERKWKGIKDRALKLGLTRDQGQYRGSEANKRQLQRALESRRIEIDFTDPLVGYAIGVLDSDGYTDNKGQIGLEVADAEFIEKFESKLSELGFNPQTNDSPRGSGKQILYACSQNFVDWYENKLDRFELTEEQKILYLEGLFEGDGSINKFGYPMICSTDDKFKRFLQKFLKQEFDFTTSIWTDGVAFTPQRQIHKLFRIIDPVVKNADYYDDDRFKKNNQPKLSEL